MTMALDSGKHIEKEIDGTRCRVIEAGISEHRMNFLREVLTYNGIDVKFQKEVKKDETLPDTFIIGVTDVTFNPVISVYQRKLKTLNGKILTPLYWRQETEDSKVWYWKINYNKE